LCHTAEHRTWVFTVTHHVTEHTHCLLHHFHADFDSAGHAHKALAFLTDEVFYFIVRWNLVALEANMNIWSCTSGIVLARVSSSTYHLFIFIEALITGVIVAGSALVVSSVCLSRMRLAGVAIEIRSILKGVIHHVVVWAENLVRSHFMSEIYFWDILYFLRLLWIIF